MLEQSTSARSVIQTMQTPSWPQMHHTKNRDGNVTWQVSTHSHSHLLKKKKLIIVTYQWHCISIKYGELQHTYDAIHIMDYASTYDLSSQQNLIINMLLAYILSNSHIVLR